MTRDQTAIVGHPPEHRDWKPGDPMFAPQIADTTRLEAFVSVDAGMLEPTRVGERSWLMKHTHQGHDAAVGDDCEIAPGCVIGGHAKIGNRVKMGVNVSVLPFVEIGDDAVIGAGAVVTRKVRPGQTWSGNPATPSIALTERRFWDKVAGKPSQHAMPDIDKCWDWNASMFSDGYGQFWWEGVNRHASRLAFMLAYKRHAGDKLVCHACDNPPCCNPAHLFLGTTRDNAADMVQKGRVSRRFGIENATAKLTDDQVAEVRRRYAEGGVTQRDLAREFGVDQSLVSLIATGKHRVAACGS